MAVLQGGDWLLALGAFLSGLGAVLTGWAALRYARRQR